MVTLLDSYPESNSDSSIGWGGLSTGNGQGQSFVGNGSVLDSAVFYLKKTAASAGTIAAAVYAVGSGTHGTNAVPTASGLGTPLATSNTMNATSLSASLNLETFTFSGADRITLVNGTPYIVAVVVTSNVTGQFELGKDSSSASHSGNASRTVFSNWTNYSGNDFIFYVYVEDSSGSTNGFKVYNGSTWDVKPVKYFDGSDWVEKPLKRYNGSTWEEVSY